MHKTKIFLGLTMALAMLAITAIPAGATIFTGKASTTGSSELKTGTSASLLVAAGGIALESSKTPDTWTIQDSKSEQKVTKAGGHLDQKITFEEVHGAGMAPSGIVINNPVEVQFIATSATTSVVNISKNTEIKIPISAEATCTVKLPAAGNEKLSKVVGTNVGENLELKAEVSGLKSTSAPAAACSAIGIPATSSTGTFKAISIEKGVNQS